MTALSPTRNRLSIGLLAAALALAGGALPIAPLSAAGTSPWYGRWTVNEDRPVFTARGRQYKTIDIAPCGRDFCGVSVDDAGACGVTLFRFLGSHAGGDDVLHGHGRWGAAKKNVQMSNWEDSDHPGARLFELYLGDGYDFGERSDNMPKFHANYRHVGEVRCTAR